MRQRDGSDAPTSRGRTRLVIHLVLTRVLVLQLLLRPKENYVASKLSGRAESNLRMVAAVIHYLCYAALAADDEPPSGDPGRGLAQDIEVSRSFHAESERLRETGLPSGMDSWIADTHVLVRAWASAMLRAASNAAAANNGDIDDDVG